MNEQHAASGKEPFATPRNLAAGTLQLNDHSKIPQRGLKVVIFKIGQWLPGNAMPVNESAISMILEKWNLPIDIPE